MRIAIDFRIAQNGRRGIGVYVRDLVKALLEWHPEHDYILLISGRRDLPLPELNRHAQLYAAPGYEQHVRRDVFEQISLPSVLERLHIDVYHSPTYVLPCVRPLPCSSVVTVHDASMFAFPEYFRGLSGRRTSWLIRRSAKKADIVVADSDFTRSEIRRYLGEAVYSKTRTIYAALPSDLETVTGERAAMESRAGSSFALGVGLNASRKNVARFVEAIDMADSDDCSVVLVGEVDWGSRRTQQLAESLVRKGRLVLGGRVNTPTLAALYRSAGALVLAVHRLR